MQSVVNSVHKGVDRVTDVVNRTWEYKNAHPHAFAAAIIASSLLGKLVIKLAQRYVKSNTILELTFDSSREFTELIDPSEEWFSQHKMEFRKFVETLQVAAKDKRVIGIIARISSLPVGLDASHVEVRIKSIKRFAPRRIVTHKLVICRNSVKCCVNAKRTAR
jgi:hypothetical protein